MRNAYFPWLIESRTSKRDDRICVAVALAPVVNINIDTDSVGVGEEFGGGSKFVRLQRRCAAWHGVAAAVRLAESLAMTPPGCELLGRRWQNRLGHIFTRASARSPPSLGKDVKCKYAG